MRYQVILPKSVQKELDRLPDDATKRVLARLAELEKKPPPLGVKKLKGRSAWRIRAGDYRVIYEIHDRVLQVFVITPGPQIGRKYDVKKVGNIDFRRAVNWK